MAWDPKGLILADPPTKKEKDDADAQPIGNESPKPSPKPSLKPSPKLSPKPSQKPSPKSVLDRPKSVRVSIAPQAIGDDDINAGNRDRARKENRDRRVHFDVRAEEMGANPPSFGWFVCLSCTMFSLTVTVLFIAYFMEKPPANMPSTMANTTVNGSITVASRRLEETTSPTLGEDGVQNTIDVIYHE
ncbi:uncharacterized protein LOC135388579 [Ornithodoros turicata]|uniref:uncharacterized protein LOC135388579 n=1 Tax=Ornithodoros turicata TaxID=34597 RepID=UPI00313A210C